MSVNFGSQRARKRFYKKVSLSVPQRSSDAAPAPLGQNILLDGKPVHTPAGRLIDLAPEALALAVAQEWREQKDEIMPHSMPMMQLVATAIDLIASERETVAQGLLRFLDTDLLCFRSPLDAALRAEQARLYDPWLQWFAEKSGISLPVTEGLRAVERAEAKAAALPWLNQMNDFALAGLQLAAGASGSLVLSLALYRCVIAVEDLALLAELEADLQAKRWGADEEAMQARAARIADLGAAAHMFKLLT